MNTKGLLVAAILLLSATACKENSPIIPALPPVPLSSHQADEDEGAIDSNDEKTKLAPPVHYVNSNIVPFEPEKTE